MFSMARATIKQKHRFILFFLNYFTIGSQCDLSPSAINKAINQLRGRIKSRACVNTDIKLKLNTNFILIGLLFLGLLSIITLTTFNGAIMGFNKDLSIDVMVEALGFGCLSGQPGFTCWISFAPVFSFIYC